MKSIMLILFALPIACATTSRALPIPNSLSSFESIHLGDPLVSLETRWGRPQEKEPFSIEGVHFIRWQYGSPTQIIASFLIDQKKGNIIVEKIFFPPANSKESNLDYLMKDKFKGVKFEKIMAKCAHFGEFAYLNKSLGLYIISNEGKNVPVTAIAEDTTDLVTLHLKEEVNRQCWK